MADLPSNTIDERGHHYGRLVVEDYAGSDTGGALWWCSCECGGRIKTRGKRLRTGRTVSCGCWRADHDVRQAARLKVPRRRRREIARLGNRARRKEAR